VIGVQQVPREDTDSYGIVERQEISERSSRIDRIVEKPKPEEAPSTLAVVGRYILTPRIFTTWSASARAPAARSS
jgi:UTP--glucose-1-phosphate uridylyltransferase